MTNFPLEKKKNKTQIAEKQTFLNILVIFGKEEKNPSRADNITQMTLKLSGAPTAKIAVTGTGLLGETGKIGWLLPLSDVESCGEIMAFMATEANDSTGMQLSMLPGNPREYRLLFMFKINLAQRMH